MRMSNLVGRTTKEVAAEAEIPSYRLMLRAGMIRRVASGIYDYLPLGWRVMQRIQDIIRQEMDAIDGQEISMPIVQPADLWQQSKRWYEIGPELFRLKDRGGRDAVLAMTHEEAVTDIARGEVESYRQLPFMLYQIQTKERDEPRPRGGLMRGREFLMKDAYSFHRDHDDLRAYYPRVRQAYLNIFKRCGVDVVVVAADVGMMGGSEAHEFMVLSDSGEDTLAVCAHCGWAANVEVAAAKKPRVDRTGVAATPAAAAPKAPASPEAPESPKAPAAPAAPVAVATPEARTIEEIAAFLGQPTFQALKTLVYWADGKLAMACIRGDLEVNEIKLNRSLRALELRLATPEEVAAAGLSAGFMSPVGRPVPGLRVIADDSLRGATDLVAGANRPDHHYVGVDFDRDCAGAEVADIARVRDGDPCPACDQPFGVRRGIEAGHIFQLGTKYSVTMGATYLDADNAVKPIVMGCYGIGVGRLMACVIERSHDEHGIIWPASVSPYQLHLLSLGAAGDVIAAAEDLYQELCDAGWGVLYDDRDVSAGFKFNDADLLGVTVRLAVSRRTLDRGGVEVKLRRDNEARVEPRAELLPELNRLWVAELAKYR